jgi:hypothetical protein
LKLRSPASKWASIALLFDPTPPAASVESMSP